MSLQNKIVTKFKSLKPIHYVVIFFGIVLYFGAMIGILNYRGSNTSNPPKLEIKSPIEGDVYSTKDTVIVGETDPDAEITVGSTKSFADNKGVFSFVAPLEEGVNVLRVIATRGDQKIEKTITVKRTVSEPVIEEQKPIQETGYIPKYTNKGLNNSGPESFWLFEAGALSAAGVAFSMSRNRLQRVSKK